MEKVEVGGEKEAELVTMVGGRNKKRDSRKNNLEAKEGSIDLEVGFKVDA
jgi:hypothetical protein